LCLNETYNKVRTGKYLSDAFPILNSLKKGDALSPSLLDFALEYTIRKVPENKEGLEINGTNQLLAYADGVNFCNKKVKLSRYMPWRHMGGQEV
jgi:hypothetical protein